MGKMTSVCGLWNLDCCFFSKSFQEWHSLSLLSSYCFVCFTTWMKLLFPVEWLTYQYFWNVFYKGSLYILLEVCSFIILDILWEICQNWITETFPVNIHTLIPNWSCLFCVMSHPVWNRIKIMFLTENNHNIGYLQLTDLYLIKVKPEIRDRGNDEFSVHTAPDDSNVELYIHLHLSLQICSEL